MLSRLYFRVWISAWNTTAVSLSSFRNVFMNSSSLLFLFSSLPLDFFSSFSCFGCLLAQFSLLLFFFHIFKISHFIFDFIISNVFNWRYEIIYRLSLLSLPPYQLTCYDFYSLSFNSCILCSSLSLSFWWKPISCSSLCSNSPRLFSSRLLQWSPNQEKSSSSCFSSFLGQYLQNHLELGSTKTWFYVYGYFLVCSHTPKFGWQFHLW